MLSSGGPSDGCIRLRDAGLEREFFVGDFDHTADQLAIAENLSPGSVIIVEIQKVFKKLAYHPEIGILVLLAYARNYSLGFSQPPNQTFQMNNLFLCHLWPPAN